MSLSVTKVEFFHLKKGGKMKAFVTVTFNNILTIKNFKVCEGEDGLFVGKPSAKGTDDKWYDNVFVTNKAAWAAISDAIIAEYEDSDGVNTPRKKRRDDDEEAPKKKAMRRNDVEEDDEPVKKSKRRDGDEEEAPRKRSPRDDEDEPKPKKKIRRPVEDDSDDEDLFN